MNREVWITGLGIASPLGFTVEKCFKNICDNKISKYLISTENIGRLKRKNASLILDELPILSSWNKYGRCAQLALIATKSALEDSKMDLDNGVIKSAICFGTMLGQIPDMQKSYCELSETDLSHLCKNQLYQLPLDFLTDVIAEEFNVLGMRETLSMACVSSSMAVGIAYQWIQQERAEIVICGGSESFSLLSHQIMSCLKVICPEVTEPFGKEGKGFLLGEGAGVLILESKKHALKRNVTPYCAVKGYGISCDANDMSHPSEDGEGLARAMKLALQSAHENIDNISFINAHGVGTSASDKAEYCALKNVFQKKTKDIPTYSVKGALGHTSGAAGAINLISAVKSFEQGKIPSTANYSKHAEYSDLNIQNKAVDVPCPKCGISNAFGFGGLNTSILLGRASL